MRILLAVRESIVWILKLLFDLRRNYGGGNEDNGDFLQKVPCRHYCTECPGPCSMPPLTHASAGDSCTLTGKSTNYGKFLKRWQYQTTWSASWEIYMQVKKQQLELDMEQQTGSKLGKEYVKAVYCHLAYLTYMQSSSCEMPGWMKHKLKSRLLGEISITSYKQMTPPLCRKRRRTKEPLDESERGEWNSWLKAQHSGNKDHGIQSITSWQIDEETVETVADFILGSSTSLKMVTAAMKLKDAYSLEGKLWPT